jgi:hypothetical protein
LLVSFHKHDGSPPGKMVALPLGGSLERLFCSANPTTEQNRSPAMKTKRFLILFGLLLGLGFAIPALGQTCSNTTVSRQYYVSNAGSDSNDGLTTSTPWQTIAHVNSIAFCPGDSISFNRGNIWREQLVPAASGTSGNPITYNDYGSGALPVMNGAFLLTGWTLSSGNIWTAPASLGYGGNGLILNGSVWGTNTSGTLTANGQWSYVEGHVSLYSTSNPNSETVEIQARTYGIEISGLSYLNFNSLAAYGAYVGVNLLNSSSINITNMTISYNAADGIYVNGGDDFVTIQYNSVLNNAVAGSGGDNLGIAVGGTGSGANTNITVDSNTISGTYYPQIEIDPNQANLPNTGIVVSRNNILDGQAQGIRIDGKGESVIIVSNLMNGNAGDAILDADDSTGSGTTSLGIYNNTISNNGWSCIRLTEPTAAIVFQNNICSQNVRAGIGTGLTEMYAGSFGSLSSDYNVWYNPSLAKPMQWLGTNVTYPTWLTDFGGDVHSINANPNFTTPGSAFTLLSASPAIAAGANLTSLGISALGTGAPQTFGAGRSCGTCCITRASTGAWDMGAYPYSSSVAPSPPTGLFVVIQ